MLTAISSRLIITFDYTNNALDYIFSYHSCALDCNHIQ